MQISRFTSSKPSKFAFASDEKSIRQPTTSFVRCYLNCQVKCNRWLKKTSKGNLQPRYLRERRLILLVCCLYTDSICLRCPWDTGQVHHRHREDPDLRRDIHAGHLDQRAGGGFGRGPKACRSQMAEDMEWHPALDVFESCSVWTERRIASTWTPFG